MGVTPKDWDIATDALPEQVQSIFERVLPTGIDYGTVTVMVEGEPYEVTTFRADNLESDGRRPASVRFSKSIHEDLARRDFTINAMAYDPLRNTLVDPFNGLGSIQAKEITAVGVPKDRFREDGLRILRAIRFSSTKGFTLTPSIKAAIPDCLDMLEYVSKERVRDEILKILGGSAVGDALQFMQTSGIFSKICPELAKQPGVTQNRHHAYDVWEHTRKCLEAERTGNPLLRLAILLHDIAKPSTGTPHPKNQGETQFIGHEDLGADMAQAWMREYRFSGDEVRYVGHLVRHHLIFFTPDWSNRTLRRWLRKVGPNYLEDLLDLPQADLLGKGTSDVPDHLENLNLLRTRIKEVDTQVPHSVNSLAINGEDVMRILDINGGPVVGKILSHLLDKVTDDPALNTVEQLSSLVLDWWQLWLWQNEEALASVKRGLASPRPGTPRRVLDLSALPDE